MSFKTKLIPLTDSFLTNVFPSIQLVDVSFIGLLRLPLIGYLLQSLIILFEIGIAVLIITLGHLAKIPFEIDVIGAIIGDVIMGIALYGGIFGIIAQSACDAVGNPEKQEKVIRYQLTFLLFNTIRWSILVITFYSGVLWAMVVGISVETILFMIVCVVVMVVAVYQVFMLCKDKIQSELKTDRSEKQKLVA